MDFSDVVPNVSLAVFSPDSSLLAICTGQKVVVKNATQLDNLQVFSFPDTITAIEFSPNSQYILVCMPKRGAVEARSVYEEEWVCKIEDPAIGLLNARWTPDSRQIITFSDFQLRASIYSLVDKSIAYIKNPKFTDKGISFSSNGKFMALAERKEAKDYIGIYYCGDWKLINYFFSDTYDLADIKWSPDDTVIVAWDTFLEYKLLIFCPLQGLIAKYHPYEYALGIKTVKFCNNGQYLGVGSHDEKLRLFNSLSWKLIIELEHKSQISDAPDTTIFKEEESKDGPTRFVTLEGIVKLNALKSAQDKPNPNSGISLISWSFDKAFVATKTDWIPNVVWIWETTTLSLKSVLIQSQPVKFIAFSNHSYHLAVAAGTTKLYFWSLEGASVCDVPYEGKSFCVNRLDWSTDSKTLLLFDKNEIVIAYPPAEFTTSNDKTRMHTETP